MSEKRKWDLVTRVLHWTMAGSVIGLLLTSLLAEGAEEVYGKKAEVYIFYIHLYLGLFSIGSVTLRLAWGFIGPDSVNWRGLISGAAGYPAAVKAEIEFLMSGKEVEGRSKAAHNPLAVPAYLGALFMFGVSAVTGLGMWDHLDKKAAKYNVAAPAITSPAYADDDGHGDGHGEGWAGEGAGEELAEEIHEAGLFWVSLYLVLHLTGIGIHYVREDKEVIWNMIKP